MKSAAKRKSPPKHRRVAANVLLSSCVLALGVLAGVTGGCSKSSEVPQSTANSSPQPSRAPDLIVGWQQRLESANRSLVFGDIKKSQTLATQLLVERPGDYQALILMRDIMIKQRDIDGAIDVLGRLQEVRPARRTEFQTQAAKLLVQFGRHPQAIRQLSAFVRETPNSIELRQLLARLLSDRGYTLDANRHARKLCCTTSVSREVLVGLIFPTRSDVQFESIKDGNAESWSQAAPMRAANSLMIGGDPVAALRCLDECVFRSDSTNAAAIALQGRLFALAKMVDRLADWVGTAPSHCVAYADYWIGVGHHAIASKPDVAADCFLRAIELEPQSIAAHSGLMLALDKTDKQETLEQVRKRSHAIDHINRDVLELRKQTRPPAQLYIDIATQLMAVGRPVEGIAWQELALRQVSPNSPKLAEIPQYKARMLRELPGGVDRTVVLMRLDRSQFPSASAWIASLRSAPKVTAGTPKTEVASSAHLNADSVGPVFENVAEEIGIDFQYLNSAEQVDRYFKIYQGLGAGVACLDYDRDGNVDFYFGQGGSEPPDGKPTASNALYRNVQPKFSDVCILANADDLQYSIGITSGDWNQDGFDDLLIGNLGTNTLLINQGDGTFRPSRDSAIAADAQYTTSVAIADVTGDAMPDIVEVNYVNDDAIFRAIELDQKGEPTNLQGPLQFKAAEDHLFVSLGDETSRKEPLGGQESEAFCPGLAVLVTDLDGKPGNEVFVANDVRENQLWSQKLSTDAVKEWTDLAVIRGIAYGTSGKAQACMGIAAADFDQNGRVDLHITNFENEWSNHFLQNADGGFTDAIVTSRLNTHSRKMLGFGTQAIDYDNNTLCDLIVGNGHIDDLTHNGSQFEMPTQVFTNRGSSFDQAKVSGDDEYWGGNHLSRGMARCDFNRDGLVDVVITELHDKTTVLRNKTPSKNGWIQLVLVGVQSERNAIGAKVVANTESGTSTHVVQTGDGYLSKNESVVFIGLGKADKLQSLEIHWPSGHEQTYQDLAGKNRWLLVEGQKAAWRD